MAGDDDDHDTREDAKAGDDPGDALKDLDPQVEPDTEEGRRKAGGIPDKPSDDD